MTPWAITTRSRRFIRASRRDTEDVDFYVGLAADAEGPVVELAVGTGRIAIPIVERTGRRVIGIDISPEMLALARQKAAEAGVELELREGDMRELALDEPTDLVICRSGRCPLPTHEAGSRSCARRGGARAGGASPGTRSSSTRDRAEIVVIWLTILVSAPLDLRGPSAESISS